MSAFETIPATDAPVRIIQVGAGGMGRAWLRLLAGTPGVELAGVVDLNLETARAALRESGLEGVPVAPSLTELAGVVRAQAVVNVTVPAAHHPVNVEAHLLGLPVLCEKPVAPTVAQALSLAAVAEATGQLLMVSQSRRYFRSLSRFRQQAASLGDVGVVNCDFYKAPHFGGFREDMAHVLLVDMAIHAFDAARYLLDQDPVSVYCEEFNPGWSWYAGNAAATAVFEMGSGARFTYTGSWCADGFETSWNGNWRINGANGTALWDGASAPVVDYAHAEQEDGPGSTDEDAPEEIAGALAEFLSALRTGETPSGEVHSNILSLAMVEAAVRSAETGKRVLIADVVTEAYGQALAAERLPAARAALEAWPSPLDALLPASAGRRAAAGRH